MTSMKRFLSGILIAANALLLPNLVSAQKIQFTLTFPDPGSHIYHVELRAAGWNLDTIDFKMPKWMPGYYQIMDYGKSVDNMVATDDKGKTVKVKTLNDNTWQIVGMKNKSFRLNYDVKTSRQFVAISYVDAEHAYLIPENSFVYIDGHLNTPVSVKVNLNDKWNKVATGLETVAGKPNEFSAPDFDILYDCPILIGNLEELPAFKVKGIEHRFIGFSMGEFDRKLFMEKLKAVVEAGVAIIGDIPYQQYTFIAIGPGRGGIEHLNNTTVSFDGSSLNNPAGMNKMLNFLAHEYFHHYNVKRIRPFELGPFDYDRGNRTNLLWVSEGLSVYYEYLLVKRAQLADEQTLFEDFEANINTIENNPGRLYQSLTQSSYNTWRDGPFGVGEEAGKTISYYDKGPIVGLLMDFAIRHETQNQKSLDDVMRLVYWKYYKHEKRGFTDAEFQQACEQVTGHSLAYLFEYIYTTKELDYTTYLGYAGLKLELEADTSHSGKKHFKIVKMPTPNALQTRILKSWLGE